jgi:autophagy-related protein 13
MATSSASSSQVGTPTTGVNRTDQIIHRVYLKTVGVLVDGRLTHYGGGRNADDKDKKKDKWVNVSH